MMSIPSVVLSLPNSELCGRANATIRNAKAQHLNTNGRCLK